jgi:serine protease Do
MDNTTNIMKNKAALRVLAVILCAVMLMMCSGYVGGMIVKQNLSPTYLEAPQSYTHIGVVAGNQNDNRIITDGFIDDSSFSAVSDAATENGVSSVNTTTNNRQLTLPELFDGANPAVVAISTEVTGQNAFGQTVTRPASGSGFFVSADGYIVTNDHVIENARNITVLLYDGSSRTAAVIGRDPASDIAVIKIETSNRAFLTLGNSDVMRVGDQVAAIGNPLGELANSMTVGYISALSRDITIDGVTRNKLQTDAALNPGNSGGPLLNLRGEVIGIVSSKSAGIDVEGLGFAIPSNHAGTIIDQLIEYGFVRGRAVLGIQIQEIAGRVQVATVTRDSAAERAGLRTGDIILAINETTISTFSNLRAFLDNSSPGDTVELRIRRGNTNMILTATLDEYRPSGV